MSHKQVLQTIAHQVLDAVNNHRHELALKHLGVLIQEIEELK